MRTIPTGDGPFFDEQKHIRISFRREFAFPENTIRYGKICQWHLAGVWLLPIAYSATLLPWNHAVKIIGQQSMQ